MNGKTLTTSMLVGAGALLAALQYSQAASSSASATATPALKIGVVSVREVFSGSKKYMQCQAQATRSANQARTELEDLAKRADADEAELKVLKQGTADYVKQLQIVLEARAKLQNQQELLKQQRMMEDKTTFEGLYQEVLKAVDAVAKEKGLDLVLERTEPKFPMSNDELSSTVAAHKVLYAGGAVDLTNEVTARVDAGPTPKP